MYVYNYYMYPYVIFICMQYGYVYTEYVHHGMCV